MPNVKKKNNDEDQEESQAEQISDMLANPPEEDEEEIDDPQVEKAKGQDEGEEEESEQPEETPDEKDEQGQEESSDDKGEFEDEKETPQETIERLRSTIEKISGGDSIASPAEPKPEGGTQSGEEQERPKDPRGQEDEGAKPSEEDIQEEVEDIDIEQFVTPEEFEEMQTDPQKFNEVMKRIYKQAENNARQKIMQDVPRLVQKTASRQATYQQAVQNFYDQNPDLKPFKKFVSVTMNEVASENPDMNLEEMLQETASRARNQLALAKDAKKKEEERREEDEGPSDQPAFAHGSKGGRSNKGGDTRDDQQKQIDDMIS